MNPAILNRLVLLSAIVLLPVGMLYTAFSDIFLQGIGLTLGVLTLLWLLSLYLKDSSIIDIYWGFGFVFIAWFYHFLILPEWTFRSGLFLAMISIWGIRLSLYIGWRNWGKPEDYRYTEMRADSGKNWWWYSLLKVFYLQGTILWIVSSVFVPGFKATSDMGVLELTGFLLWIIGFFFETVGDCQMSRFKNVPENKGKVMDQGLWKYTRHPNYFGDACVWWGFFLFGLGHSQGWWFVFSPLFMTFLLVRVSGVAMLEEGMARKKPAYRAYMQRTSAFFPWFPATAHEQD